jgi:hypothetical protein
MANYKSGSVDHIIGIIIPYAKDVPLWVGTHVGNVPDIPVEMRLLRGMKTACTTPVKTARDDQTLPAHIGADPIRMSH